MSRSKLHCYGATARLGLDSGRRDVAATELFVDQSAMALTARVSSTYGGTRIRLNETLGTLARWQEQRAKELLASHLTDGITLASLAEACKLSVRHFTRAFRRSTGLSPHEWLRQLRIERAKQLLMTFDGTLADIALECGFADQSHLNRVFQRSVGVPPGAWRRLHQRARGRSLQLSTKLGSRTIANSKLRAWKAAAPPAAARNDPVLTHSHQLQAAGQSVSPFSVFP